MTELRFVQIDAFADRPFTGNPAAWVACPFFITAFMVLSPGAW